MESRRITVLSAGLGVPSSSRLLADQLAASADHHLAAAGYAVEIQGVELRELAVDIANHFSLEGKAVLLGATAGTDRHQMVLDFAMRPLFSYLRTRIASSAVFAGPQDWGHTDGGGSPLSARIDRAAGEFIGLLQGAQPQQKQAALESLPFEQLLAGIPGRH